MIPADKIPTILLVEDNPDDVDLTLRTFKRSKIANRVEVVRDGQEALDMLFSEGPYRDRTEPLPKLILLDLKLPRVDGLEVLQRLKADLRTRQIPVVILTSSKQEEDLMKGYDLGANSYIRKPVDFGNFQEMVDQLSMYWLIVNQPPPKLFGST